jgi:two-component system, sensor histidine kinase
LLAIPAKHADAGLSGVLALLLLRLAHYLRLRRNPDADDATLHEWGRSWKVLALVQALCWAVSVWLFWDLGTPCHRTALMPVIFSLGLASVQLLATRSGCTSASSAC